MALNPRQDNVADCRLKSDGSCYMTLKRKEVNPIKSLALNPTILFALLCVGPTPGCRFVWEVIQAGQPLEMMEGHIVPGPVVPYPQLPCGYSAIEHRAQRCAKTGSGVPPGLLARAISQSLSTLVPVRSREFLIEACYNRAGAECGSPPNVAVGRAASDATTAEPSIFVAGSLASQSPKVAGRCDAHTTSMHIHASCNQPTGQDTPLFHSWTQGGKS